MSRTNSHHYAIIVAGGSGTRLWPISRKELPKQIQKLVSDKTLIEETAERLADVVPYENLFISTTTNYADKIREILPQVPYDNVIVEPVARGTTAAFALFSETIYRRDAEAIIFSLASDHAVKGNDLFHESMRTAFSFIEKHQKSIAIVGVKPTKPDTGLGYIKIEQKINDNPLIYSVEKFVEKPGLKVAKAYLDSGEYYWNTAYSCFKAQTLIEAYEEADPAIMKGVKAYLSSGKQADFETVPIKSQEIDIINASRFPLALVAASFDWSDIGNWDTLHDLLAEVGGNPDKTVGNGQQYINIDSTNCMVRVEDSKKLVATVGLDNVVIVDTKDALLVLDKAHTQDVKAVLEAIKQRGLNDYL